MNHFKCISLIAEADVFHSKLKKKKKNSCWIVHWEAEKSSKEECIAVSFQSTSENTRNPTLHGFPIRPLKVNPVIAKSLSFLNYVKLLPRSTNLSTGL